MTVWTTFAELAEVDIRSCPARNDAVQFLNEFSWPDHPVGLSDCVTRVSAPYHVKVQSRAGSVDDNRHIRFFVGNELRLSVTGHDQTVFVIASNVLYIAEFCPISAGCSIAAFNLQRSTLLWRTELHGIEFVVHSMYRNRVQLDMTSTLVVVRGHEGGGDYAECLDKTTGTIVGHRIFRHWAPKELERIKESRMPGGKSQSK